MAEDSLRSRQSAFEATQLDRDRTLSAIHRLEESLSRAAGGKEWTREVKSSLDALQSAMSDEQRELENPGSLLTLISAEHPRRFGPRVRGIKEQFADISRQLGSFRRELDGSAGAMSEIADLRHRASWIIRALHNCRNRQADLVFEALHRDLGRTSR